MRLFILAYMVASVAAIAPLRKADPKSRIPGRYIVALKPGASMGSTKASLNSAHAKVDKELENLNMITVRMAAPALERARAFKDVLYIEEDGIVELESNVAWGLDRVDQRSPILNNEYSPTGDGRGVNVYFIDTGINRNHVEFKDRVTNLYDFTDGGDGIDCNGHGTHCAGTIGGTTWGIAKKSHVFSLRVFGCTGGASFSTILEAMDFCRHWIIPSYFRPHVVSMSLGGKGITSSMRDAVVNLYNAGIVVSVAAGNSKDDACQYSPAGVPEAITVGAIGRNDVLASFTNTGQCVDIYAPGVDIPSAWYGSNSAEKTISGTSMACPHVSGAAALYLQANPQWTPAQVWNQMLSDSTLGANGIRILYVPKKD